VQRVGEAQTLSLFDGDYLRGESDAAGGEPLELAISFSRQNRLARQIGEHGDAGQNKYQRPQAA